MFAIAIDAGAVTKALVTVTTKVPPTPGSLSEAVCDYIEWHRKQLVRVLLPAPALAEALAFFQFPGQHDECIAALRSIVEVVPFDFQAASRAAELWKEADGKKFRKDLIEQYRSNNQCVKVDYQIAATAARHGAKSIISFDKKHFPDICKLAGLQMLGEADLVLPNPTPPSPTRPRGPHSSGRQRTLLDDIPDEG